MVIADCGLRISEGIEHRAERMKRDERDEDVAISNCGWGLAQPAKPAKLANRQTHRGQKIHLDDFNDLNALNDLNDQ